MPYLFCAVLWLVAVAPFLTAADPLPGDYAITWTSPGASPQDSMPLAGGNLALNVWTEQDDVLALIASPNALNEQGMQVKLGRLRLHLGAGVFAQGFQEQRLDPQRSEVVVRGRTASGKPVTLTWWCAVAQPVVHVEVAAEEPVTVTVTYEALNPASKAVATPTGLQWMRRLSDVNARRLKDLKAAGLTEFAASVPDPLSRLTLGGRIDVPVAIVPAGPANAGKLAFATAAPVTALDVAITIRQEQDADPETWAKALAASAARAKAEATADRVAALAWWSAFWQRSHIVIAPQAGVPRDQDQPWLAARNYQLIRYQTAGNVSGRAMTLFNGGLFTCVGDPDKRFWDSCQFMAQNQRLVYWPMLASGDFDLLSVATDFYRDRTDVAKHHARTWWGVDGGVAWPEAYSLFGLSALGLTADGRCKPSHLNHHFTSGMEFALMMLELGRYTGVHRPGYQAPALGILAYYDQFYQATLTAKTGKPLDADGRLVIYPSDACEPYHGCTNNTDVIAGLTALVRELLALPATGDGALTPAQHAYVSGFQQRIPEFPLVEKDGRRYYAAAKSWERVMANGNMDFPQMYVCFPFTILSLGRSDMTLAKNTWDLSPVKADVQHQNQCWYQTAINFARMGLTTEAAAATLEKLLHPGLRFPTFYVTHYADGKRAFCHPPDTDHGGTSMLALQNMLMQVDGRRILVAPAWPATWDVHFKLCAPYQTTVEGRVTGGKVTIERVVPESRRRDIETGPW